MPWKFEFLVQCLQWDRINYFYSILFLGKLLQTPVSLNFYSKFLDVLFTFPVQVFENERIEETYRLWYFEAEKAYLRIYILFNELEKIGKDTCERNER